MRVVIIPNVLCCESQKQSDIIHKQGINDVKELDNFLAFVNVSVCDRTR
jgi:hypothetical protein